MHRLTLLAIPFLALALGACSESSDSGGSAANVSSTTATWLLADEPADVLSILEAKESAKEGDVIAIRGRIGGRMQPMSEESNIFTFIDLALPHCGQTEHDSCPTPWDYCCDPPNVINAHGATIQVLENGTMPSVLPTAAGLKPLDELIVVGTVAPRPDAQVLTIRATGIYRVEG
jgi:hypothetical protein